MKHFTNLYTALDETTKTNDKVGAMVRYFRSAAPADAAWAVYFLSGRKPRQAVPSKRLYAWTLEASRLPAWLVEESLHAVGDVAETIALLVPPTGRGTDKPLHWWVEEVLLTLRQRDEAAQHEAVLAAWAEMNQKQIFVWNKLITGEFRVGVSQLLVTRALAEVSGLEPGVIAHRLMGDWSPSAAFFTALLTPDAKEADASRPYPFCLAHPLEEEPAALGDIRDWQAEWKWDGIRSQLIRRSSQTFLWSRGEELVTDRYPELRAVGDLLPEGTVIDGEILPWRAGSVLPFAQLQKRIGRTALTKKLLEEVPVILMAYDLLEFAGEDVREKPLQWRREQLTTLANSLKTDGVLQLSPLVWAESWADLERQRFESRERFVEGLMLKRLDSTYRVGRVRGGWWKWKVAPYTIDAVLIYAQPGHGKRASLFTDYTFGVWDDGNLVPVAKAYSGLTDEEIRQVDGFIRKNTLEKFGPVRTVKPELVFELAFEGIQASTRHKSGIAVRFPRMLRWRTDKKPEEADTLERVRALLAKDSSP
jgi:ATP-dependent DNA ligase